MHVTSIMLPSTIEWCNEDDRIQKRLLTSATNSSLRCWSSRTSSLSLFSDEIPDSKKCSLVKKAHLPSREITMRPAVRPSLTESKWNLKVEELLVDTGGLSTKSMRRIMNRDSLPESRTEGFQCLRLLDQWSDEIERQSMQQQTEVPVEMHQRRHSNTSLVRIKGSQLRRRLFSSGRESSSFRL
jgi:hypothetical protein